MRFKVGDEVVCIKSFAGLPRGRVGVIKFIRYNSNSVGVIWKDFSNGHGLESEELRGRCDGYWVENTYILKTCEFSKKTILTFKNNTRRDYLIRNGEDFIKFVFRKDGEKWSFECRSKINRELLLRIEAILRGLNS